MTQSFKATGIFDKRPIPNTGNMATISGTHQMRGSMTMSQAPTRRLGGNLRLGWWRHTRSLSTGPQARRARAMPDM